MDIFSNDFEYNNVILTIYQTFERMCPRKRIFQRKLLQWAQWPIKRQAQWILAFTRTNCVNLLMGQKGEEWKSNSFSLCLAFCNKRALLFLSLPCND